MNTQKNYAFIDGQNLHLGTTMGDNPWKINLVRFKIYLQQKYNVKDAYYFLGYTSNKEGDLYKNIQAAGFILNFKEHNEELLEIFNEQTFIWWNKSDIIELINNLIKKYIRENSDIYNITIYIKMTIQSLIDKPIELLDFINERLKPKDIEKKTPKPLQ
jgi:hypothetical protein